MTPTEAFRLACPSIAAEVASMGPQAEAGAVACWRRLYPEAVPVDPRPIACKRCGADNPPGSDDLRYVSRGNYRPADCLECGEAVLADCPICGEDFVPLEREEAEGCLECRPEGFDLLHRQARESVIVQAAMQEAT